MDRKLINPVRSNPTPKGTDASSGRNKYFIRQKRTRTFYPVREFFSNGASGVKWGLAVGMTLFLLYISVDEGMALDSNEKAKSHYDMGVKYLNAKDYQRALIKFQEVIKDYPKSIWADNAWLGIGVTYETQGKYLQAIKALQKLLADYPRGDKAPNAQYGIGDIYEHKLKDYSQAISAYNKVIKNYPESKHAHWAKERLKILQSKRTRNNAP